jgi:hypothetical protein
MGHGEQGRLNARETNETTTPVLRGPQIFQRSCQFQRTSLNAHEQPHVFDRDRRLIRERGD